MPGPNSGVAYGPKGRLSQAERADVRMHGGRYTTGKTDAVKAGKSIRDVGKK